MVKKNLKTKKSNNLIYIIVKLFLIKTRKKIVSYKLELPKNTKVDLVFHILQLELANLKILMQDMFYYKIQEKHEFKVKKFLIQND